MKIFVDGGIRQGTDIFKALAMGADAVLIARPFVQAVYGGAEEGVKLYIEKLAAELSDTMAMCGAASIKDINRSMLYRPMQIQLDKIFDFGQMTYVVCPKLQCAQIFLISQAHSGNRINIYLKFIIIN